MQTFLPYPNFAVSAMFLSDEHLDRQRTEARQVQTAVQKIEGLIPMGDGLPLWASLPVVDMWRGHVLALMLYGDCMVREWVRRGYENHMPLMMPDVLAPYVRQEVVMPPWLGDEEMHSIHRAGLLFEDPEFYSQYGWDEGSAA